MFDKSNNKGILIPLLLSLMLLIPVRAEAQINPGDIVINETFYDAPTGWSEPDNEWIEIYNSSVNVVNLSNWTITDNGGNTITIPVGTIIGSGELVILVANMAEFSSHWTVPSIGVQVVEPSSWAELNNSGDSLSLKDTGMAEIDYVNYGSVGANPAPSVPAGHSGERNSLGADTDNSQLDFVDNPDPSPGMGLNPPPTPVLLTPANGSTTSNSAPSFTWTEVTDPDSSPVSYNLQVDDDPGFSTPEIFEVGISSTAYIPSSDLTPATYYWRVQASDGVSHSDWTNSWTFTIIPNQPPTITLISPNGGENWSGVNVITWIANDPDGDPLLIDIQYSCDGGAIWSDLALGEADDGNFSWDTTSVANGSNYLIKIIANDGSLTGEDLSDGAFTIDNGGGIGNIVINEVFYDALSEWGPESDYEWIELYNPSSQRAYIGEWRITDAGDKSLTIPLGIWIDIREFIILTPDIVPFGSKFSPPSGTQIIDPSGWPSLNNKGDSLALNNPQGEIIDYANWGEVGINPAIDVEPGHSIERAPAGKDTDNCFVDFYDNQYPTPGEGLRPFNRPPSIELLSPNGGEIWSGVCNILWMASDPDEGNILTIAIFYSSDGGDNWISITSGEANDGIYSWNTASVPDGDEYLIKVVVTDSEGLTDEDESDESFSIDNIAEAKNIVINEVFYDADSEWGTESNFEWVELYNPLNLAGDVGEWIVENKNARYFTIPTGTMIKPRGFIILVNDRSSFSKHFSPPASATIVEPRGWAGLNNTGDSLNLLNIMKDIIDSVNWGDEGVDPAVDVEPGHSIERMQVGKDTNNCSQDFIDNPYPTPGEGINIGLDILDNSGDLVNNKMRLVGGGREELRGVFVIKNVGNLELKEVKFSLSKLSDFGVEFSPAEIENFKPGVTQEVIITLSPRDIVSPGVYSGKVWAYAEEASKGVYDEFDLEIEIEAQEALNIMDNSADLVDNIMSFGVIPGLSAFGYFIVENVGNVELDNIIFKGEDLKSDEGHIIPADKIEFFPEVIPSLDYRSPNNSRQIKLGLDIPPDQEIGSYRGKITAEDDDGEPSDSFQLEVVVEEFVNLKGSVFVDSNENGIRDPGEKGVAKVRIDSSFGDSAITDSKGDYSFLSVPLGEHTLSLDISSLPRGYKPTISYSTKIEISPLRITKVDFGIVRKERKFEGMITGSVFYDENGNYKRDEDEEGIAGVKIILVSGMVMKTDEEGNYSFTDVKPGDYLIALDDRTLPLGMKVSGDTSEFVSVEEGEIVKIDFAVESVD